MSTTSCGNGMSWSKSRTEKQNKESVDLLQALANTILEEQHKKDPNQKDKPYVDIRFSQKQRDELLQEIRSNNDPDALSSQTIIYSNELAAFNSNPNVIRALRVACEFVRAGELVSDGMEINSQIAVQMSNSPFYKKVVKRTGQVHLAASAAMTFFALKTIWQVFSNETDGSTPAKVSAAANTAERVGDFGGDIFETITEWRMISSKGWLTGAKMKVFTKGMHYIFSATEIAGKGAEHIRYLIDEDAPLFMKVTSTMAVLLDSGGLALNTWATQAAVKHVETIQGALESKALVRLGKEQLDKTDDILKILSQSEIDEVLKKFPLKNMIKGGLVAAQVAFILAEVITGTSSLITLNDHQKALLAQAENNPNQDHYKQLAGYYQERFRVDAGFLAGRTAIDSVFAALTATLVFTGAGLPLALAVGIVAASVSSILSYAQQQEIESLSLKRVAAIEKWERENPGKNYFDQIFNDRYNQLKPEVRAQAKILMDAYRADRSFALTQLYTTEQINEAVGLFYRNKQGVSSDRLFIGEFSKNGSELIEKISGDFILNHPEGTIFIKSNNENRQLLYATKYPILTPANVKWKYIAKEVSFWQFVKKEVLKPTAKWLAENVFTGDQSSSKRMGSGTSVGGVNSTGDFEFFEQKENEHLFLDNVKDWTLNLGNSSTIADLSKFVTRVNVAEMEYYQTYEYNGGYMYGASGSYVTRSRVGSKLKTISIHAKSGNGDDQYKLGTGNHNIDAGAGTNTADYRFINEQSSIRIEKSKTDPKKNDTLIVKKTINGQVFEEFVGSMPVVIGSKKYQTQYRGVKMVDVNKLETQDTLTHFSAFQLGYGENHLDLTGEAKPIHVEINGHTNDIKLGNAGDLVVVEANTNLKKNENRKNWIRTRGGKDHIVIKVASSANSKDYYNENFICGGIDLDADGNPSLHQATDKLEYIVGKDVAGFFDRSRYGLKVNWERRINLQKSNPFFNDLKNISLDDGYLKIERYAPIYFSKDAQGNEIDTNIRLVGTDYAVHINELQLTDDNDEVNIDNTFNDHLVIHTGRGNDKITLGNGSHVLHVGSGFKTIKLGNGNNVIYLTLDKMGDTIKAGNGENTLSYKNNTYIDGEREINYMGKIKTRSKLGVQIDLKAGKALYHLNRANAENLGDQKNWGSNLISLSNEKTGAIVAEARDKYQTIEGFQHLEGTTLNDVVLGNEKDNKIATGAGDDRVNAREGDDDIDLGLGADIGYGGSGDDTFYQVYDNASDKLYGDSGSNMADYSKHGLNKEIATAQGGLNIDLSGNITPDIARKLAGKQFEAGAGWAYLADEENVDQLVQIQNARGTEFSDRFKGNNENNHFYGLDGTNRYEGLSGDDFFYDGLGQGIFVFNANEKGHATINDQGGDQDVMILNMVSNLDQFKQMQNPFERELGKNSLKLKLDKERSITINNQFLDDNKGVEYVQFANGNAYKLNDMMQIWSGGSNQLAQIPTTSFNQYSPIPQGWL